MSTFLIIFGILAFIAGILSRSKPTIEITDKNRYIVEKNKFSGFSKEELKSLIITEGSDKKMLT